MFGTICRVDKHTARLEAGNRRECLRLIIHCHNGECRLLLFIDDPCSCPFKQKALCLRRIAVPHKNDRPVLEN